MVFNCFDWPRMDDTPKIHPTQKPVPLLERLIEIFTDVNDVVIDPAAGSGTTLLAARNLNRRAYGFEIKKNFYDGAQELLKAPPQLDIFCSYETRKQPKQVDLIPIDTIPAP